MNNNLILILQGRATQTVLKMLKVRTHAPSTTRVWFFADYTLHEIPAKTSFDVLLEGESKKLLNSKSTIKIITAIDQFGHKLPSIPEGFKTICRLEFYPSMPASIKKLPLLDKWEHNTHNITLAQHEGIERYLLNPQNKETVEQQILRQQKQFNYTNFLNEIVGKWPGEESVEEVLNTLD